ncbi:MAG: virulence RhuM family protein [Desulfobacterales bacterium]|nr:virulence RhuM family protein [Desulfobacterales bacterium]
MTDSSQIQIYQTEDGLTRIQVRLEKETVWLSRIQMAELFDRDSDSIGLHLKKIYKSGELEPLTATEESSVVRQEGKRTVKRKIKFYNLDAIISVGYRVNSKLGVQFRIWATQRLKEYLIQGYSINQQRFEQNAAELSQALALIQKAAQSESLKTDMGRGLVDILGRYTQTFLLLQQYDERSQIPNRKRL